MKPALNCDATPVPGRALRRLAALCLALMVVVVAASASLRHFGATTALQSTWASELAALRVVHRIAATLVLLGAVAMWVLGRRARDAAASRLAAALVGVALLLSVLGLVAGASRDAGVVVFNLLGGFVMLVLCTRQVMTPAHLGIGRAAWSLLALLVLQAAAGAAASADPMPGCVWLSDCSVFALFHRTGGVVLALVLMAFGLWAMWRQQHALGPALAILAGVLMLMGLLNVALMAAASPPWLVVLHNALAALTLACLARMA
jgi:hypothetical protein